MEPDPISGEPQSGFWMQPWKKHTQAIERLIGLKSTPARKLLINATIGFQTKQYNPAKNSWSQSKDH
jgi:hypothetical protein